MAGPLRYLALLAFAAAAHAGFDEGEQAFKRRDFRTALSEFTPLADGGDARAQYYLGVNGATLQSFLEANGVGFRAQPASGAALSAADVGEQAARYTVAIECAR
jgi:TPR repeat protein